MRCFNQKCGFFALAVALCLFVGLGSAWAGYPEKDVTWIVPWAAGGGTDVISRFIADKMEKDLGKAVIVVNKEGGGGVVGFQTIAAAKPNGYTIGNITLSTILQKYSALVYVEHTKFAPIGLFNMDPSAFTVKADSPWKTLKEAMDWAKANPGKLRISNSGPGAIWHVAAAMLENTAGVKFTHVPYKGGNPAAVAVAGGHVEATTVSPAEVSSLVKAGKLRMLAICSDERDPSFPDVPTFKEAGVDLSFGTWRALVAPAGTPDDVVKLLADELNKIANSPEYKEFLKKGGFGEGYRNPQDFLALLKKYDEEMGKVVPSLGLKKK